MWNTKIPLKMHHQNPASQQKTCTCRRAPHICALTWGNIGRDGMCFSSQSWVFFLPSLASPDSSMASSSPQPGWAITMDRPWKYTKPICDCGATHGVTVSMSAFLACHQCYCAGLSLAWGLNLRPVVCGIFWSSSPGVFSGYSSFLPSFIG